MGSIFTRLMGYVLLECNFMGYTFYYFGILGCGFGQKMLDGVYIWPKMAVNGSWLYLISIFRCIHGVYFDIFSRAKDLMGYVFEIWWVMGSEGPISHPRQLQVKCPPRGFIVRENNEDCPSLCPGRTLILLIVCLLAFTIDKNGNM